MNSQIHYTTPPQSKEVLVHFAELKIIFVGKSRLTDVLQMITNDIRKTGTEVTSII